MNPQEFYSEARQTGKSWWVFLLLGLVALAVGIWMFCNKAGAAAIVSYIFAAYFLLSGIVDFATILMNRKDIPGWGWPLALSIIVFCFGIALFCAPLLTAGLLNILFAVAIICLGIRFISMCALMETVLLKILIILFGILVVAAGVMCIFNPLAGIITIATVEALSMIFSAIACFVLAYELSKLNSKRKKLEKAVKSNF